MNVFKFGDPALCVCVFTLHGGRGGVRGMRVATHCVVLLRQGWRSNRDAGNIETVIALGGNTDVGG